MSTSTLCPFYNNLHEKSINQKLHGERPQSKANALSLIHPPPLHATDLDRSWGTLLDTT